MTGRRCSAKGCVARIRLVKGFCKKHYSQYQRTGSPYARPMRARGQGTIHPEGYVYVQIGGRRTFQHRFIMERHLGRKLLPNETVHHKNGNRQDNRWINLELWSSSQPPGQRVKDKVRWARNLLKTYGVEK